MVYEVNIIFPTISYLFQIAVHAGNSIINNISRDSKQKANSKPAS